MPPGPNIGGFEFTVPKFTVYRAICERLEANNNVLDASKCFLQMGSDLPGETTTHREQADWVIGKCSYVPH